MTERLIPRLIQRSPLRWWLPNHLTRMEAIQRSITALSATDYLEVGVSEGVCFSAVSVQRKVGVDPIAGQPLVVDEMKKLGVSYFALPSDEFFRQEATQVLGRGVDVVFIDGLHTCEQAYRDCINALAYLNRGGIILLHDCLPASESEARPAGNYEEALQINGALWGSPWTGDVWKAIVTLRALHPELETHVLQCDYGVGVVHRGRNTARLSLTAGQIDSLTYSDLARQPERLLGVRRPRYLLNALKQLRAQRG